MFPAVDSELQAIFDQGREVGSLAKKMFSNGVEIDVADPTDFEGATQLTKKHLPSRRPIFEAALSTKGGYARADILNPVSVDSWDLAEVKSTTGLKEQVHLPDEILWPVLALAGFHGHGGQRTGGLELECRRPSSAIALRQRSTAGAGRCGAIFRPSNACGPMGGTVHLDRTHVNGHSEPTTLRFREW
jgi:hypothetical protein